MNMADGGDGDGEAGVGRASTTMVVAVRVWRVS